MADPKDQIELDERDLALLGGSPAAPSGVDLDERDLAILGGESGTAMPSPDESQSGEPGLPEPSSLDVQPQDETGSAADLILGLANGATLNYGDDIAENIVANPMSRLASWEMDLLGLGPDHTIDGQEPTYAGTRGLQPGDITHDVAAAERTELGSAGKTIGNTGTAMAAAAATGGGTLGLMGTSGLVGGASEYGDSEDAVKAASSGVLSALTAGLLSPLGGAVTKSAKLPYGVPGAPQVIKPAGESYLGAVRRITDDGKNFAWTRLGLTTAKHAAAPTYEAAVRAGTNATTRGAIGALSSAGGSRAVAQDSTKAVHDWATQAVLSSGDSGLPPDDEQMLTEAILSGDDDRMAAVSFKLKQRYPDFDKRIQDQIRSVREE